MNKKSIKTMCLCCMTYHIYVQWGKSKILISKNQCDGARAYPIWFLLLGDYALSMENAAQLMTVYESFIYRYM